MPQFKLGITDEKFFNESVQENKYSQSSKKYL